MPRCFLLAITVFTSTLGCGGPSTTQQNTQQVAALIEQHRQSLLPKLEQISNAYSTAVAAEQPEWNPWDGPPIQIPLLWSDASSVDSSGWNTVVLPENHVKYIQDVSRGDVLATENPPQSVALYRYITNRLPKTPIDVTQCLHDSWRDRYFRPDDIGLKFTAVRQAEYLLVLRELERTEPELNGTAAFTPGSVLCAALLIRLEDGELVAAMPFSSTNDAELDYDTQFGQNQSNDASAKLYANLQEKLEENFHEQASIFFPGAKLRP